MNHKADCYYWDDFLRWCFDNSVRVAMSLEYKLYWDCWRKAIEVRDKNDN